MQEAQTTEALKIDPANVKTDYTKPKDLDIENMSQEQIFALLRYRSKLLEGVTEKFQELIKHIYEELPIHVLYRNHAFMNLDQGMHWLQTAINNVNDLPEAPVDKPADVIANAN